MLLFKLFIQDIQLYQHIFMFILVLGYIKYFYFCLNHPLKTYDYIYYLFMFILVPGIIDYFFFSSNNPFKTHNYRILILGFIEYFCYHLNNLFKIDDYNQFFFFFIFISVQSIREYFSSIQNIDSIPTASSLFSGFLLYFVLYFYFY